ncbi:MAG: dUTP diphosphatase [Tessaracoccus sp.]|uniref:dUTP diphosphatase n=1 Tax=Tessaracoccus sp. TaxID=1971211 RepID=UPI001EB7C7F8|nr:dUTP diphosphatase [Tessaracoccus sp.]MBK7820323.1 dUTP diphosphatase [Tessaracoccus sp.]
MRLPTVADDGHLPHYARPGDAGADLVAAEDVSLEPGERKLVGTGVRVAIPEGHVGLVTPRSGLAARTGLSIVNAPGVIDSGYRGEIKVCLINLDPGVPITLAVGDRIAQLLITPFVTAEFELVDALDDTARGAGGYGSTGGFARRDEDEGPQ